MNNPYYMQYNNINRPTKQMYPSARTKNYNIIESHADTKTNNTSNTKSEK